MNKTLAYILVLLGIVIVAAVFLAAPLHLASAGFGTRKIIGLVIGVVVLLVGLVGAMSKSQTPRVG